MFKTKMEALKARLYEKKAESQSVGTVIGIIAAVILGIAVIGVVTALVKTGALKDAVDTKIGELADME